MYGSIIGERERANLVVQLARFFHGRTGEATAISGKRRRRMRTVRKSATYTVAVRVPYCYSWLQSIVYPSTSTIILVGECNAFLASGSDPTDDSRRIRRLSWFILATQRVSALTMQRLPTHERVETACMNTLTAGGMNAFTASMSA